MEEKSILQRYSEELTLFLNINEFNVKEVQMKLPGMKHLFVGRLIRHKSKDNELKRKKDQLKSEVAIKLKTETPIGIPTSQLNVAIERTETISSLNQEILENELIIEFLEKTEKILSSATFDIKNIIEINKLETT